MKHRERARKSFGWNLTLEEHMASPIAFPMQGFARRDPDFALLSMVSGVAREETWFQFQSPDKTPKSGPLPQIRIRMNDSTALMTGAPVVTIKFEARSGAGYL